MTLKARLQLAFAYSLPALLVTGWFVTDAHSNWIGLQYGEVVIVGLLVLPVWLAMTYAETRYRLTHCRQMPVIPIFSMIYPLLYLVFFYIVGFCQSEVDKLDLADADGYASTAGFVGGAWLWYGLVLVTFVLLSLIRGRKSALENPRKVPGGSPRI